MEGIYRTALAIAVPLWRGIPADYKAKYALNIWSQFENNLRSAAYTTSLKKFVDTVAARLAVVVHDRDVQSLNAALASTEERALLKILREETTYIVLLVRAENDLRREKYKAGQ